jgi:hypothetical protein
MKKLLFCTIFGLLVSYSSHAKLKVTDIDNQLEQKIISDLKLDKSIDFKWIIMPMGEMINMAAYLDGKLYGTLFFECGSDYMSFRDNYRHHELSASVRKQLLDEHCKNIIPFYLRPRSE